MQSNKICPESCLNHKLPASFFPYPMPRLRPCSLTGTAIYLFYAQGEEEAAVVAWLAPLQVVRPHFSSLIGIQCVCVELEAAHRSPVSPHPCQPQLHPLPLSQHSLA